MAKTGLNLDTLQLEGRPEPYTFTLAGRGWKCVDPETVDWLVIETADQNAAADLLPIFLGDLYEDFVKLKVPNHKAKVLLQAVIDHYSDGLKLGEGDGSPTS